MPNLSKLFNESLRITEIRKGLWDDYNFEYRYAVGN